jgi:Fe-S-cluster containining protein
MFLSMRRQRLLDEMDRAEANGVSCKGCAGTCCTYEANSMMVTPWEALELLHYLQSHSLLTETLRAKLEETVRTYRLDHAPGNGKRSFLRKTYTCSFFGFQELGCPLPREVKPYGCLAFNTHHPEMKAGEHCYSDKALLEELDFEKKNGELKEIYKIFWDKSPLPTALLDLWDREVSVSDLK